MVKAKVRHWYAKVPLPILLLTVILRDLLGSLSVSQFIQLQNSDENNNIHRRDEIQLMFVKYLRASDKRCFMFVTLRICEAHNCT